MAVDLAPYLALDPEQRREVLLRSSCAYWAQEVRHLVNAPFHEEWYRLRRTEPRLCVVAPRDHAKSEVFTVNGTAHDSIYQPGLWTYIFANIGDQAAELKARVELAIAEAAPRLVLTASIRTRMETVLGNGSRITAAGAGKSVRGVHPDRIVGDDVLNEETTGTEYQRRKIATWWFGTVSPMAHPGTFRQVPGLGRVWFQATRITLVGTPFHQADLLLSMRKNPLYHFRRYAAEFDPEKLVDGSWAVEVRRG